MAFNAVLSSLAGPPSAQQRQPPRPQYNSRVNSSYPLLTSSNLANLPQQFHVSASSSSANTPPRPARPYKPARKRTGEGALYAPLQDMDDLKSPHYDNDVEPRPHKFDDEDESPKRAEFEEVLMGVEGATLYEKKCMLINREIDKMGMGKYQWYLWGLCGFGYLVDLLWAQAFGLILQPLKQEFGFGDAQQGNISVSFSAGLTARAAFWGILVDIIGRKWAFNLTVMCSSIFGLALGGSNSYTTFLVLTAFIGFGVGGNIPIDTTITLEFIPQRNRRLLPFLSIFQPIGVVITTAIAYGFIPTYGCKPDFTAANALPSCNLVASGVDCCSRDKNMGWRYLMFTLGAITFAVFIARFVLFNFQESPKFLIYRGKDSKAIEVLNKISKFNKRECDLTLEALNTLTAEHESMNGGGAMGLGGGAKQLKATWGRKLLLELDRYKMLFATWTMASLTILVWLTYWCDYWGFTVAGTFLPSAIAAKNAAISHTIKFTYRTYIYIYLPGILGVLLGVLCYDIPRFGRKYTMAASAGLMGASLFIFATINSTASNIGINLMEYFFQSMFNAVLYGWTPEAFPAPVRGTACGVASFWGRLAGIVSPLIAAHLIPATGTAGDPEAYDKVLYLAGGVTLGCVLWTALLPSKMVGRDSM